MISLLVNAIICSNYLFDLFVTIQYLYSVKFHTTRQRSVDLTYFLTAVAIFFCGSPQWRVFIGVFFITFWDILLISVHSTISYFLKRARNFGEIFLQAIIKN